MSRHSAKGAHWERFRRYLLNKVGWRCARCGGVGRMELHHIKRLSSGGAVFDEDNIEVLCRRCHLKEHHVRAPTTKAGIQRREWEDFLNA